jgi:dCTP deaminase
MILSQPDIRREVKKGRIVFDPPLEEKQWGEASVDLRLGFIFTRLVDLPNMKVSVADGFGGLARAGFWERIELTERDEKGDRRAYTLAPGEFVLAMTHEAVTVPRNMIGMVEGRSTYARVGLTMHQTAPWIQPGWDRSRIILEIKNNGPLKIELTPLIDRPCQLTFMRLTAPVPKRLAYGSRPTDVYQGQEGPFPSGAKRTQALTRRTRSKPSRNRATPTKPRRTRRSRSRRS